MPEECSQRISLACCLRLVGCGAKGPVAGFCLVEATGGPAFLSGIRPWLSPLCFSASLAKDPAPSRNGLAQDSGWGKPHALGFFLSGALPHLLGFWRRLGAALPALLDLIIIHPPNCHAARLVGPEWERQREKESVCV